MIFLLCMSASVIGFCMKRECRNQQAKYYVANRHLFFGEASTNSLKEKFLECFDDASQVESFDDLIIDVGANTGQSFTFFRWLAPKSYILFFEPNPATVVKLRKNLANEQDVKIFHGAVGEFNGSFVKFNLQHSINEDFNEHGSLAEVNVYEKDLSNKVSVPLYSLDAVVIEEMRKLSKRSVRLLKIDTEGFDQMVLYGAKQILEDVQIVLWECHELQREVQGGPGTTLFESVEYMEKLDFHTFLIGPKLLQLDYGLYHPHYDVSLQWQNCLSIRRNSKESNCVKNLLLPVCKI